MDFKKLKRYVYSFTAVMSILAFFNSCSEKKEKNIENTYYVELVNFKKDSLENFVSNKLFGKVAFYKGSKLEVLSVNYITDATPGMHYFNNATSMGSKIEQDTKKIRIEFAVSNLPDSVTYSLQKFRYNNKQWVKTSDMGFLTARTDLKTYYIDDLASQIMHNTVLYTFDQ